MRIFLLLCCIGNIFSAQAQTLTSPPPGVKYAAQYTVEETSFYTVPAGAPVAQLKPIDLQKMKKHREVSSVQKQVLDNGDHSSLITVLNPEEAYAEWPEKIGGGSY